ncbi:hypothetical protein Ait01nite_056680 [Actinoplanes italicus]|uniref:Protein phosphatase 2C-like protein n=1 Tax=Actinoplanes italicus TaxID=113567 RepID=A0A2T0K5G5_9ACTN|nr:hypothetical protein [Actinoplanes italicus]PRX18218.1 hypothetical protein CLV67_11351 [Actinoplanes italicus]GIE32623.1 hypothetical protein Ait01nite_056680 [Actinoplanes italicus]
MTERALFAGPDEMRAAAGVDGGTSGVWTVRAGWHTNPGRRPHTNCDDTVSVWRRGHRLLAVAAAAGASGPSPHARAGVRALVRLTDTDPAATAGDLVRSLATMVTSRAGDSSPSFAVGVFPVTAGRGSAPASVALLGPYAGIWRLGADGRPEVLLSPGEDGPRPVDRLELDDGDIICLGAAGLASEPGGERFSALWRGCPDDAGFLRFLGDATVATGEDVAAVALWYGRYLVGPW